MTNRYEFTVVIAGYGEIPEEAWVEAVEGFMQDPGPVDQYELTERDREEIAPLSKDLRKFLERMLDSESWWSTWIQGNKMPMDIEQSESAMVVVDDLLNNELCGTEEELEERYPHTFWFYNNYTAQRSEETSIDEENIIDIWDQGVRWETYRKEALAMEEEISRALEAVE